MICNSFSFSYVNVLNLFDDKLTPEGWEVGLGRFRVLSVPGKDQTAIRWYEGDRGPRAAIAEAVTDKCVTCGFYVAISGSLGQSFGVCTNKFAADDAKVVSIDHGCGGHSEIVVDLHSIPTGGMVFDDNNLDTAEVTDEEVVADAGPLLLSESVTDPAPKVSATVPSPVQVTDTDQEVGPPEAEGVPQPAAVPLEVTSPAPMVASSLKMMLKLAVCEPTGDVGVDHAAVGPVASIVTVVAFSATVGPAPSDPVTELAAIRMIAVPSVVHVKPTV